MKLDRAPLSGVCRVNPTLGRKPNPDGLCSFVPMESVNDWSASIVRRDTRHVREVSKGYTPFKDGDVLVAKITPCMENGKCAIARGLTNGIGYGSTEFHVLRAGDDVLPEWLYYFWRYPPTRREARRFMRGSAGQQRVPDEFFDATEIPLPDLPIQRRIAGILDQADRLRRMRRYALELSDQFLPVLFLRMFGDPAMNPNGWEKVELGEVCAVDAPMVDPRDSEYRDLPHIGGDNIESITGRLVNVQTAAEDGLISGKYLAGPEHVLLSKIRPNLRKVAELVTRVLCSADIYPVSVTSPRLLESYLVAFLRSDHFTRIASRMSETRANIPKINRGELAAVPIPLPPIGQQRAFDTAVARWKESSVISREALRQAEHLFQSLLNQYFGADTSTA